MAFDEMSGGTPGYDGEVRDSYRGLARWLAEAPEGLLQARSRQAELFFRRMGITFAVYGDAESAERLIPFDVVPRIIGAAEWAGLEKGLVQRVSAINAFLSDVYGKQECLKAGVVPAELILTNPQYAPEMQGRRPPRDIWVQIAGVDLVRTGEDGFYVLEDNCRTPSGVSYMLENREMMMRLFPDLFADYPVRPVETYADMLLASLRASAPAGAGSDPTIVVLTPGPFNSAYYEHSFLADKLGVELVEGRDLFVDDGKVYMRTTEGQQQVDVIYRRIDDAFLDPLTFRPDSALGVPGLMMAYEAGTVTLANAVGTGVADDKAVYTYMPEIIRFFTGEEPILNNVPTWRCREPDALKHVLANLGELVVKEVGGSGGYGMLVGPASTKAEIESFRQKLIADPDDFIAQPTLALSTAPTLDKIGSGAELAPRHVDLRPFVLSSPEGVKVAPGGLTRVALKPGSLVVNSSQGGGTKDTWVLDV
ncbi:circularly permuted type 2 ATP-grasp protein [Brevundimonas sp. FT23042]|uniref:circularly permuted type 2 ATP-grasp protein n=1 Tax=Brevundimonas sp. FT23042 TaxID=3393749 RepID=UPI003B589C83